MPPGDWGAQMSRRIGTLRVMRIIARMNVGGPALQAVTLMRGLPADHFEQRLYTGFVGPDEADYIDLRAPGLPVYRVPALGRRIGVAADARALAALTAEMRRFRPTLCTPIPPKPELSGGPRRSWPGFQSACTPFTGTCSKDISRHRRHVWSPGPNACWPDTPTGSSRWAPRSAMIFLRPASAAPSTSGGTGYPSRRAAGSPHGPPGSGPATGRSVWFCRPGDPDQAPR